MAGDDYTQPMKRGRMEINLNEIPSDSWDDFTDPLENALGEDGSRTRTRKPTKHWTSDEHDRYLEGLKQYGRGKWKEISKLVSTKTPKQVASHAQKYFIKIKAKEKPNGKGKQQREAENIGSGSETDKSQNIGSGSETDKSQNIGSGSETDLENVEPLTEIHPICLNIDMTPQDMHKVKKVVDLLEQV